jgi:hypothetical protein
MTTAVVDTPVKMASSGSRCTKMNGIEVTRFTRSSAPRAPRPSTSPSGSEAGGRSETASGDGIRGILGGW